MNIRVLGNKEKSSSSKVVHARCSQLMDGATIMVDLEGSSCGIARLEIGDAEALIVYVNALLGRWSESVFGDTPTTERGLPSYHHYLYR